MGLQKEINIRTSYDEMEAYIRLSHPSKDERYFKQEIMNALKAKDIKIGLDEEAIDRVLAQELYEREVIIARGTPVENGQDGFYQYNFDLNLNTKPTILADGTVDYWNVHAVEMVEEGQVIAVYHEPVMGHHGMTVKGKLVICKPGRQLPPLRGKGFERSEDGSLYIASITGKIEMNNDRIVISPVYEVNGNVDLQTGNIDFRGDVVVHGNVCPGALIQATGSVTVDGTVEACTIDAGKDVILKGGCLGAYKGVIKTRGNLTAKFIEYATVEAEGYVDASSALNCQILCNDHVYIKGKKSSVVGGSVYGASGVDAQCLGSVAEVTTNIKVGVSHELMDQISDLQNRVADTEALIEKINFGIKQLETLAAAKNIDIQRDERRVSLLRTRIAKQAELSKAKEELLHAQNVMERCKDASVRVLNTIYPGVYIEINSCAHRVNDEQEHIQFEEHRGNVMMFPLSDDIVD